MTLISGAGLCFKPIVNFMGKEANRATAGPKP